MMHDFLSGPWLAEFNAAAGARPSESSTVDDQADVEQLIQLKINVTSGDRLLGNFFATVDSDAVVTASGEASPSLDVIEIEVPEVAMRRWAGRPMRDLLLNGEFFRAMRVYGPAIAIEDYAYKHGESLLNSTAQFPEWTSFTNPR